jgi:hypothetical protein
MDHIIAEANRMVANGCDARLAYKQVSTMFRYAERQKSQGRNVTKIWTGQRRVIKVRKGIYSLQVPVFMDGSYKVRLIPLPSR